MVLRKPQKKILVEPSEEVNRIAHEVIGAALEVHRELGPGFLESVYEEAMAVELKIRGVPCIRQAVIEVGYKDNKVGEGRVDLLVPGKLIVELKAVEALLPLHSAQLVSYLKMTGIKLGLLINFNVELLKQGIKRIINPRYQETEAGESENF